VEYSKRDELALTVAYLTSESRKQHEIAELLHISQAEVSRLLRLARDHDWIDWEMHWPDDADQASIKRRALPELADLQGRLNDLDPHKGGAPFAAHVVHSGPVSLDHDERLKQFGRLASEHVGPLLSETETCAVAWGRTIRSTVDGISAMQAKALPGMKVKARPGMRFMPISGEPFNHKDTGISPSTAARLLSKVFGCEANTLSLEGVAARIPKVLGEEVSTIRRLFNMCHDYEKIFGGDSPLIESVDMILSGIGDIESSENDPWFRETAEAEQMDKTDLNEIAVGNLGGVWLAKDPGSKLQRSRIEQINKSWLGIQEEHFVGCTRRASERGSPGVVVVAIGPAKAEIVKRSMGMINHLVIDHDLAKAILGD
jgi:DNA-binding transcriptional regulator LsrR (DeoR family)